MGDVSERINAEAGCERERKDLNTSCEYPDYSLGEREKTSGRSSVRRVRADRGADGKCPSWKRRRKPDCTGPGLEIYFKCCRGNFPVGAVLKRRCRSSFTPQKNPPLNIPHRTAPHRTARPLHLHPERASAERILTRPRRPVACADANGRLQVAPPWPDHEVSDLSAPTSRNTEKVQEGRQAPGQAAGML